MKIESLDKVRDRVKRTAKTVRSPRMNLKEWLVEMGLSIVDFSRILGVSRAMIYYMMQGKKMPSETLMDTIREISLNRVRSEGDLLEK